MTLEISQLATLKKKNTRRASIDFMLHIPTKNAVSVSQSNEVSCSKWKSSNSFPGHRTGKDYVGCSDTKCLSPEPRTTVLGTVG